MVFSSINFIYFFLPAFLIVYYLVPEKYRNLIIFTGSLIFYGIGSFEHPQNIFLLLMFIMVNYIAGNMIEKTDKKKLWLAVGLIYDLSMLFFFKYACFIAGQLSSAELNIILPVGISFYTFQAISYLADIYRKEIRAEKSLVDFGAYLAMFPQLIAGPIVKYSSIKEALHHRKLSMKLFVSGCRIFILGLGYKVLLANQIGGLWRQAYMVGFETISVPCAWMSIFAYSFQLYFDFYGYSLMAIGLGKMLSFRLPVNFKHPYMSTSMTEFFRRWHITLGDWFKNYVYIPLGGNRNGKMRTTLNLLVVWLLTGIWHGAGYNFVIWGLTVFILIVIEKNGLKKLLDKNKIIGHLYMLFMIPLMWSIFANTDINQLITLIKKLFGFIPGNAVIFKEDYIKYLGQYWWLLLLCTIFSTPAPGNLLRKIANSIWELIILILVFCLVAYCLYKGMDDPFLYFQF